MPMVVEPQSLESLSAEQLRGALLSMQRASNTCSCCCQMKRIGEDMAEKLEYVPGVLSVERHIRSARHGTSLLACSTQYTLTPRP